MTKAQQRRSDAISALMESINRGVDSEESPIDWDAAATAMAELESLGRTDRWVGACRWARAMIDQGSPARWAVLQGSVWMCHAI
jgi:hypothetical protein